MPARATRIAAAVSAAFFALPVVAQDLASGRWVDLTHPFNAASVYWPTAKDVREGYGLRRADRGRLLL